MKKFIFSAFILLSTFSMRAQEIDSIRFVPAAPLSTDTVRVYVYLTFPSAGCADMGSAIVNGNSIYGYSFHCMGMASTICNDVDTIVLPPMAAGNYTMYYTLDAGYGPPGNCTPGFQPYDVDTVPLVVSIPTLVPEKAAVGIRVYPNPASDELCVDIGGNDAAVFQLVNILGEVMMEQTVAVGSNKVSLMGIAEGIYSCRVVGPGLCNHLQIIEVLR